MTGPPPPIEKRKHFSLSPSPQNPKKKKIGRTNCTLSLPQCLPEIFIMGQYLFITWCNLRKARALPPSLPWMDGGMDGWWDGWMTRWTTGWMDDEMDDGTNGWKGWRWSNNTNHNRQNLKYYISRWLISSFNTRQNSSFKNPPINIDLLLPRGQNPLIYYLSTYIKKWCPRCLMR
jgi:hypothetical protein